MRAALSLLLRRAWCWFHHGYRIPVIHNRSVFYRCESCSTEWGSP